MFYHLSFVQLTHHITSYEKRIHRTTYKKQNFSRWKQGTYQNSFLQQPDHTWQNIIQSNFLGGSERYLKIGPLTGHNAITRYTTII